MPNIELQRFMIFNSDEGQGEGREGDKLIFHWNRDTDQSTTSQTEQINDICLCDACINVSDRLNENFDSSPQEASPKRNRIKKKKKSLILRFEHSVIVVLHVEPDESIWMAAKVVVESDDSGSSTRSGDHNSSMLIPAEAIKRLVSGMYLRFCLLRGNFSMIIEELRHKHPSEDGGQVRDKLRTICKDYFGQVLKSMHHLSSILANETALYNNLSYLDLNPITILKVISFTNHLVCMSNAPSKIRHTLVIFNDQLLWSSLTLLDTRLLFNYLISVLVKDAVQEELSKEVDKVRRIKESYPIYLTDAVVEQFSAFTDGTDLPDAGKGDALEDSLVDVNLTKYHMTVFRSSNLTLCLILDEPNPLADPIETTLTSALAALARHVGQDYIEMMRKQKSNTSTISTKTNKRTS